MNFLEKAWLNFRNFFIKIGYDAWHGLLAVAQIVGTPGGGLDRDDRLFSKLWTDFTSFFARTWENIKAGAKAWNWIRACSMTPSTWRPRTSWSSRRSRKPSPALRTSSSAARPA